LEHENVPHRSRPPFPLFFPVPQQSFAEKSSFYPRSMALQSVEEKLFSLASFLEVPDFFPWQRPLPFSLAVRYGGYFSRTGWCFSPRRQIDYGSLGPLAEFSSPGKMTPPLFVRDRAPSPFSCSFFTFLLFFGVFLSLSVPVIRS